MKYTFKTPIIHQKSEYWSVISSSRNLKVNCRIVCHPWNMISHTTGVIYWITGRLCPFDLFFKPFVSKGSIGRLVAILCLMIASINLSSWVRGLFMNHAIYWRSSIVKIKKSCSIHSNKEAMTDKSAESGTYGFQASQSVQERPR